jgi:prophage DNA circulation protein
MQRATQLEEVKAFTGLLCAWLRGAAPPAARQGRTGAELRRQTNDVAAYADRMIEDITYANKLSNCFNLTRLTGATYNTLDAVRQNILSQSPKGELGIAVQELALHFCLIQQARINAGTNFFSRDDVDSMLQRVDAAWSSVIIYLANYGDSASYLTAIALFAATTYDLTTRSRPLPAMATYSSTGSIPTLSLANMLYPDSTKPTSTKSVSDHSDELVLENHVVHPAFPPNRGRCLVDV